MRSTVRPQTATPEPDSAAEEVIPAPDQFSRIGELRWFDPRELILDPYNARKERTAPDAALRASVSAKGVQDPITVRPQGEGTFGVLKGQRRWLAAILAAEEAAKKGEEIPAIPAFIRWDLEGENPARVAEALILSLIENTQRRPMTLTDVAEQTALVFEVTPTKKGKRDAAAALGKDVAHLVAARKVADASDDARNSGLRYGFDFVQIADLEEVKDVPGAAQKLAIAAEEDTKTGRGRRDRWGHAMSALRSDLALVRRRDAATQAVTDAGTKLLSASPTFGDLARPIGDLTSKLGGEITAEGHADCPGHAARVDTDGTTLYYCTDPEQFRHQVKGQPTDAQEQAAKEKESARLRAVRKGNDEARAARPIRHEFLTELCTGRKPLSDDALMFVIEVIALRGDTWRRFVNAQTETVARQFCGLPEGDDAADITALIKRTGKGRRTLLLLAQVAAAYERTVMSDAAWQKPGEEHARWLSFLVSEGYGLSDHEKRILAAASGETVPDPDPEPEPEGDADAAGDDAAEASTASAAEEPQESAQETGPGADAKPEPSEPQETAQTVEEAPAVPQAEEQPAAPETAAEDA